jgi:sortase A
MKSADATARRPTVRRAGERACFGLAFVCLGAFAAGKGQAWLFEHRERARLTAAAGEGVVPAPGVPSPVTAASQLRNSARPGRAWGRIEIPRLGVDALVAEGVDAATLRVAVGHVPDTAFPDELGNVALAGHRDTVFRPLRELQPGDVVTVTTPFGVFSYEVDQIRIVAPHETEVIAPVPERVLTLVTCYPFWYVGPAPQRFVVRARFVEPLRAIPPAL